MYMVGKRWLRVGLDQLSVFIPIPGCEISVFVMNYDMLELVLLSPCCMDFLREKNCRLFVWVQYLQRIARQDGASPHQGPIKGNFPYIMALWY